MTFSPFFKIVFGTFRGCNLDYRKLAMDSQAIFQTVLLRAFPTIDFVNQKALSDDRAFFSNGFEGSNAGKAFVDGAENVANDRAKQHEDRNNNDSDQNKDQSIFYQTLAFFFRGE
jgi:hypothetical protein